MQPISPLKLRQRFGHPIRVAGFADDLTGSVSEAVKQAGQGIGDAARSAGTGIGTAATGIGDAATGIGDAARSAGTGLGDGVRSAGASVSDAAGSVSDAVSSTAAGAVTAAKWAIGLSIGVPLTLGLATLAALAYASRHVAAALPAGALPMLLPLLGPEGAAAASLVGAVGQQRAPKLGP